MSTYPVFYSHDEWTASCYKKTPPPDLAVGLVKSINVKDQTPTAALPHSSAMLRASRSCNLLNILPNLLIGKKMSNLKLHFNFVYSCHVSRILDSTTEIKLKFCPNI